MSKRLFVLGVVAIAVLTTSAFAANRGVQFTPIGFHEDPGPFPASIPMSMTADGQTMIVTPTPYGAYCFFWNTMTGWGAEIGASAGGGVLEDVVRRAVEVRDPRPGVAVPLLVVEGGAEEIVQGREVEPLE